MEIIVYREGAEVIDESFTAIDLPMLLEDQKNIVWVDFLGDNPSEIEHAKNLLLNVFHSSMPLSTSHPAA